MIRHHFSVDVTAAANFGEPTHVAAELLLPEGRAPNLLFVCVPGGGMNRHYFDLPTPKGEAEVSFAKAMCARGHAVALLDPPGAGDSTCPADAYLLHPDSMAAAANVVVDHILEAMRQGSIDACCPAVPRIRSIGIGHSLGALITTVQQARYAQHHAVALLGFHVAGLADHLTDADRALDKEYARANLVELARKRFPSAAWHEMPVSSSTRRVSTACATERVMVTPSLMAMLPDIVAPDAAAINVPVLIGLGDADLHGDPYRTPQAYTASPEVTLIVLPQTRHNHFVYPSRTYLYDRIACWAEHLP